MADTVCRPAADAASGRDAGMAVDAGPEREPAGGCGCAVPGRSGAPVAPLGLLALLALARRRR